MKKSEKILSDIFAAVQDLLVVIDKDLRVVMSNWKDHDYITEEERKGHPHCYTCFMHRQTPCEPCYALQVFDTGITKEYERVSPVDGKIRYVRVLPLFDDEGRVVMVVEHLRNITERKRAEEALRDSEETLKATLAASPVGIALVRNRIIGWANKAMYDMLAYPEGSLTGKNKRVIYSQVEEYNRVGQELYTDLVQSGVAEIETDWICGNGRIVHCYVKASQLDPNDSSQGIIVGALDLTERRKAEKRLSEYAAELEWKNRELQAFAYSASHDLQEPLRKIETFGSMVTKECAEQLDETCKDYIARMGNAASRMREMISALLDYSRVSSEQSAVVAVNLNDTIRQVLSVLSVSIEKKAAEIITDVLPVIHAEPNQMIQLFQNLITNSLKFCEKKPVIRIYAEQPKDACVICVTDNGIGFEQKYADRIFEPFERLHGLSRYEGSGVGLSICKKIVERHGGTIEAQSQLGQGTTIIIALPFKKQNFL